MGIREPLLICWALKRVLLSLSRFAIYFHFRDSRSHVLCLYYGAAELTTHFVMHLCYANVGGVTISDPDCYVTVGVKF